MLRQPRFGTRPIPRPEPRARRARRSARIVSSDPWRCWRVRPCQVSTCIELLLFLRLFERRLRASSLPGKALSMPRDAFPQKSGLERVAQVGWSRAGSSYKFCGSVITSRPRRRGRPSSSRPSQLCLAAYSQKWIRPQDSHTRRSSEPSGGRDTDPGRVMRQPRQTRSFTGTAPHPELRSTTTLVLEP